MISLGFPCFVWWMGRAPMGLYVPGRTPNMYSIFLVDYICRQFYGLQSLHCYPVGGLLSRQLEPKWYVKFWLSFSYLKISDEGAVQEKVQKKKSKAIKGGIARVTELFKEQRKKIRRTLSGKKDAKSTANGDVVVRDPEMVNFFLFNFVSCDSRFDS